MKITKRQLRRIIREATGDWYSDEHETLADRKFADSHRGNANLRSSKGWQTSDGRCNSHNIPENEAYEAVAVLQEFGFELGIPITTDSNNIAIDDALAAYPGEYTYDDFYCAVQVVKGRGA